MDKIADKINNTTENLKTILPPICFLILTFLSIVGHFIKKCYMNNGECKVNIKKNEILYTTNIHCFFQAAWFCLKTRAEYTRRREAAQGKRLSFSYTIIFF